MNNISHHPRERILTLRGFLAVLLFGLAIATPPVLAGNIFMKNGYIIQGPIVQHDEHAVVLGWENGKVTIYQRFVESVTFDPGEQHRLEEMEKARLEEEAAAHEEFVVAGSREEVEDLPTDLSKLLRASVFPEGGVSGSTSGSDEDDDDDSGDDPDEPGGETGSNTGDGSLFPDTGVIEPPSLQLGERVFSKDRSFSFQVPVDWEVKHLSDALYAGGPEDVGGIAPSLNVIILTSGGLSFDEGIDLMKLEQRTVLQRFELLSEGLRELKGRVGYEVIARGQMNDKTLVLHQVILPHGDNMLLFSGYSEGASNDTAFLQIEASLESFEFGGE